MSAAEEMKEKIERWGDFLFNDFRSVGLFYCISQDLYNSLSELSDLSSRDSRTDNGVALNPLHAGQCLTELQRTEAFVRGLDEAIQQQKNAGKAPVRVFYAGCGPFATLILPLVFRYSPEELQVTVLDIHRESIEAVEKLYDLIGKRDYLQDCLVHDAVTYTIDNPQSYDICLTETLQRALTQECQVSIVKNLLGQLPESVTLLPQEIRVSGLWTDLAGGAENRAAVTEHDVEMDTIVQLNAETARNSSFVRKIKGLGASLPTQSFCLQTEIDVFGKWGLARNQSGLTCPHPMTDVTFQPGETLEFEYEVGEQPGLRLKSAKAK